MSLLALIAGASLAASAASETRKSDLSVKETRRLLRKYGECVVNRQEKAASEAILADVSADEMMRRYPRLIEAFCLPIPPAGTLKVRFQGDQYHYALAEALVAKEYIDLPAPDLARVQPLYHRAVGPPPSPTTASGKPLSPRDYTAAVAAYQRTQGFRLLAAYGECVVRADPNASRALLLTVPDTREETAQFVALGTAFETCMPQGQGFTAGKLVLRGVIAVNYYRLAKGAEAAAGGAVR